MNARLALSAALLALSSGCTTYEYAKNVKMIAFDNNVSQGQGAAPEREEDDQDEEGHGLGQACAPRAPSGGVVR